MRDWLRHHAVQLTLGALALGVAGALKQHYSHASAEDLRWILAPTTWLTELVVQSEFAFQTGQGYLSREQSVLISPACAGVNFLIVAFLSLALGFGKRFQGERTRPRPMEEEWKRGFLWFAVSLVSAVAATLVVNTLRISISIAIAHLATRFTGLTFHSVHRLLGIGIYLTGLMGLCLAAQFWLESRSRTGSPARRSGPLLVAAGCYVAVTLAVPLLRGGAHNPDFWSHAAPVSVAVGAVIALLFAARGRSWDDGRHAFRSPE